MLHYAALNTQVSLISCYGSYISIFFSHKVIGNDSEHCRDTFKCTHETTMRRFNYNDFSVLKGEGAIMGIGKSINTFFNQKLCFLVCFMLRNIM